MDYNNSIREIIDKVFEIFNGDCVQSKFKWINIFFGLCDYIYDNKLDLNKDIKRDLYILIDKCHKFIKVYIDDSAAHILQYLDDYDSIKLKEKLQSMSKDELIDYICSNKVNC